LALDFFRLLVVPAVFFLLIRESIHHSDISSGSESCTGFSVCEAKPLASLALRDSTGLHGLDKDPLIVADDLLSDG